MKISLQDIAVTPYSEALDLFQMGQKRLIVDSLWIKTLIDSDLEHYKQKDLNSWMYHRFNAIIDLDPEFYEAYRYGGLYLSVVKDDDLGAKAIYDKGTSHYPEDLSLNFYAGMHYYLELADPATAAQLLDRIKFHPKAMSFLPALVARIRASLGDKEVAWQFMKEAHEKAQKNSPLKKYFAEKLYAIQAEIDLDCLNKKNSGSCRRIDAEGNPYLKTGDQFVAAREWETFHTR